AGMRMPSRKVTPGSTTTGPSTFALLPTSFAPRKQKNSTGSTTTPQIALDAMNAVRQLKTPISQVVMTGNSVAATDAPERVIASASPRDASNLLVTALVHTVVCT